MGGASRQSPRAPPAFPPSVNTRRCVGRTNRFGLWSGDSVVVSNSAPDITRSCGTPLVAGSAESTGTHAFTQRRRTPQLSHAAEARLDGAATQHGIPSDRYTKDYRRPTGRPRRQPVKLPAQFRCLRRGCRGAHFPVEGCQDKCLGVTPAMMATGETGVAGRLLLNCYSAACCGYIESPNRHSGWFQPTSFAYGSPGCVSSHILGVLRPRRRDSSTLQRAKSTKIEPNQSGCGPSPVRRNVCTAKAILIFGCRTESVLVE
ncbi:hypothetical protein EDC01DRAFT_317034 [Geopyxis carbonaria]|nr:hypothetical protein EDC01DRAFT_317034 [Geopyxis carbonaria]